MIKSKNEEHLIKLVLYKKKNEENEENQFQKTEKNDIFVFFVKDYKSNFYYWESIIFLTKFFLSFLPNLSEFLTNEQMNFIYLIIFFSYFLMVFFSSPFKIEKINILEKTSIGICVFTRLLMVMSTDAYFNVNLQMTIYSISMGINFIFYCFAGYLMFKLTELKKLLTELHKKTSSFLGKAKTFTRVPGVLKKKISGIKKK